MHVHDAIHGHCLAAQKAFDNLMHEYPEAFKAMDLVGEHRLRGLHASWAWQQRAKAAAAFQRGASRLERFLEVLPLPARSARAAPLSSAPGTLHALQRYGPCRRCRPHMPLC